MGKKVEVLANVAIIIVALLVGVALIKQRLLADPTGKDNRALIKEVSAGSNISIPGMEWEKNGKTLLLAIAPGCHYCSESAPFYQRLARETADGKAKLIAVLPTSDSEGRKYLKELGVNISEVKQVSLDSIGVTGTPTLILVNEAGVVTRAWVGQLQPDGEAEVLSQLQQQ
jgi:thiol-disulfide isomerase/thioredoxin